MGVYDHLGESKGKFNIGSIFPILQWLPAYRWGEQFAADFSAGVTIGCVLLAQSIAHAQLSGVSLIHGPYSCVVPPIVYAFLGTSKQGSVGTGGLIALLTGTQLARYPSEEFRTQASMVLAFLVGAILVLMGLLRLAGLVRFMSRPALSGFVTGSALLIVESQLPGCLGLKSQHFSQLVTGIALKTEYVHIPTMVLSICVICALLGMQSLKKRYPKLAKLIEFKELIVMAFSTMFCVTLGYDLGINVVGELPVGMPSPALPVMTRELVHELLPGAWLLAMIVFISSFAAVKKIATIEGYHIHATNELLALGFANGVGALFGSLPIQIGLSRTGIAYGSGAKSQLGTGFITATVVLMCLLWFTELFFYMPKCVLNCVIIVAAKHLVDFGEPVWLYSLPVDWRDHKDLCVWGTAFGVTLGWGACQGMMCATALSLFLLVLEVTEPDLAVLQETSSAKWQSSTDLSLSNPGVLSVRLDGVLFYANAERFQEQMEEIEQHRQQHGDPAQFVILDFSCVPFIDATAIEVLKEMFENWKRRDVKVRVANALGRTCKVLEKEFKARTSQTNFRINVMEAHAELLSLRYAAPAHAF